MSALCHVPAPPPGFAGTARYAIKPRDKRDYHGVLDEQIRYERTAAGLVAESLVREITDDDGTVVRRELVPTYMHARIGMPPETYPEVTLPFILGWMSLDTRKSLYAWINDRFVAKLYIENGGKESITTPIGRCETVKVVMYPDLNDWIALGSVLTKLAKPFIPKYRMCFDASAPHRLVRFEGPYGPPGAPEILRELAAVD